MEKIVALLFSGIAYGAVLALVALGFIVLYKATGVVNFAHGDLITLGAFIGYWAITTLHLPVLVGYGLALVIMFFVGVGIERVAYAPLRKRPQIVVVVATLAAAIVIRGLVALWQGSAPRSLPSPVGDDVVTIAGAAVSQQRLLIIAVAAATVLALLFVFQRTPFGQQVRALAEDPETARLQGVRTGRIAIVSFGLSAALAALAGLLVAPLSALDLNFGFALMVSAFAAAVLGGFGSLGGVVLGALAVGLLQQLVGGYLLPDYASSVPLAVMFVVLAFRPEGLVELRRSRL